MSFRVANPPGRLEPSSLNARRGAVSAGQAGVLDTGAIEQFRRLDAGGQRGLLARVCRLYDEDAARLLEIISAGVTAGNPVTITAAAHALKSASANLGATLVSALAAELEVETRNGTLSRANELLAKLRNAHVAASFAIAEVVSPEPA
ncbi:MAG: Hpt domain-containing protein [Proteobacteria bacterium]|nr:Hpt domain-containing protein [Pseudomonadota bacterium]